MTRDVEIAIIGAGTSGLTALGMVRKQTQRFVMINAGAYGTTCARVGCMPSKALIQSAHDWHRRGALAELGINGADALTLDTAAVLKRVRKLRDGFVGRVMRATDSLKDGQLISGRAKIVRPGLLEVNGQQIRAQRIIVATGSRPVVPAAWRALGDKLWTSDEIFERPDLPRRVAVVGLGVIGLELGQALSRLGVEVHGVELTERIGGLTDPELIKAAVAHFGDELHAMHLGVAAELSLTADGQSVAVQAGAAHFEVDGVLASLGRRPNVDDFGWETLGVPLDARGVPLYNPQTLQVADQPIFIIGDANNHRPILHEAADDGRIAATNALNYPNLSRFGRRAALGIAFTDPNIALIGARFDTLDPNETVIGQANFANQSRAKVMAEAKGLMRLYADKRTKKLVGGELMVPHGEHLAHQLAGWVQLGLEVMDILRLPIYHPVLEEGMREALRGLANRLYDGPDRFEVVPAV